MAFGYNIHMSGFVEAIIFWAISLIERGGYWGIFVTMALESAAIPIPSEVIVPFGGFLVALGKMNLWAVAVVASFANLAGSTLLYVIGAKGGRPFIKKYGRYFLVHADDISKTDTWFSRYGSRAAFFSRLLPGTRTFSSLFMGIVNMRFSTFTVYTLAGSFIWNLGLVCAGVMLGANWKILRNYFEKFEIVIAIIIFLAIFAFLLGHIRRYRKRNTT